MLQSLTIYSVRQLELACGCGPACQCGEDCKCNSESRCSLTCTCVM